MLDPLSASRQESGRASRRPAAPGGGPRRCPPLGDIQGASQSGLMTGYVARGGAPFPAVMKAPEVQATSLTELIDRITVSG